YSPHENARASLKTQQIHVPDRRRDAAICGANVRKHFLAPTGLAEQNRRRLESLRTRSSEVDPVGGNRDSSDFRRRCVDLALVFASAQAEKSFGQDRSS